MVDREIETYGQTWAALNQGRVALAAADLVASPGLVSSDVEQFFGDATDCRFYFLDVLAAEDRAQLEQYGLNVALLEENLHRSVLRGRRRSSGDSRRFQIDAVKERCLHAICPFTGRILTSRTSIAVTREVVFYRFEATEVFYLATNHIGSGFTKGAIYFPEREIIVKSHDFIWELRQEHITKLKTLMVSNASSVARYITGESTRAGVATCLGDANYAHHLWNELSGLLRLSRARCLAKVDRFFVCREPLGPITRLFPQIPAEKVRHLEAGNDIRDYVPPAMFREIIEKDYFLVNVGDEYISEELVRRLRSTFDSVPALTIDKIRRARRSHWPLVLISIRTGNRTWPDQATGLSTILLNLARTFPRLGVVVDGYSVAVDYDTETSLHPWLRLAEDEANVLVSEAEIISDIVDRMAKSSVPCFSISGSSLLEAAVWVSNVDFYITHAGSNQHKVGWLGNKPGIVHSNVDVLRRNGGGYYDGVREFGVAPIFLDPRFVRDIPTSGVQSANDLRTDLSNYIVDVPRLSEAVETMARVLAQRRRGSRAVLHGFGTLRNVCRSRVVRDARVRLRRSTIGSILRSLRRRLSS
jgi:hypothetical protein